jgi:hypothetical protein
MLINSLNDEQERILQELSNRLDISETQYEMALKSYRFVAEWLAQDGSPLAIYSPDILPQGSFLLGTMIKPVMEEDELDVDLVCQLSGKQPEWTQFNVKQKVGDRLKDHGTFERMLDEEGRRCWTLVYSDGTRFHMDILPAIINSNYRVILKSAFANLDNQSNDLSIRITDKTHGDHRIESNVSNWPRSNPFGYAIWFNDRASIESDKGNFVNESIQPFPEYNSKKLPLQRIVQLLKRHRDVMFGGDEHKPVSIAITTLAAKSYNKETNLIDALNTVIYGMRSKIEERYDYKHSKFIKWIGNPLNVGDENDENFADKWPENELKEVNFYEWLDKLETDFESIRNNTPEESYSLLKASFGNRSVDEAFSKSGYNLLNESFSPQPIVNESFLNVSWKEKPQWPLVLTNKVEISARFKDLRWQTLLQNKSIPKHCSIEFIGVTNVKKPFDVYWQIVNTGDEAFGNFRGGFIKSTTAGSGGLRHQEASSYAGLHWAQCFVVKDGVCVAKSDEFFVKIE